MRWRGNAFENSHLIDSTERAEIVCGACILGVAFTVIGIIGGGVRSGIREVQGTALRSDNDVERNDVMLRRVVRVMSTRIVPSTIGWRVAAWNEAGWQ
jgi:hypothetical protein